MNIESRRVFQPRYSGRNSGTCCPTLSRRWETVHSKSDCSQTYTLRENELLLMIKGMGALKASLLVTNPKSNINDYLRWRAVFCTPNYFQIRQGFQNGGQLLRTAKNIPLKSRLFTNPKLERTWWFLLSGTLSRKPICCRIKQYKCWYKYM